MCEYDQRVCGKRNQLPSANLMTLSGGGGEPIIQPIVTGSLARASRACGAGVCMADRVVPSAIAIIHEWVARIVQAYRNGPSSARPTMRHGSVSMMKTRR